ncbi:hypothetical protein [Streptomyces sp. 8N706]|uniref:hypothetical protein n=1 Tax=Streptomyces sp. 8N706 TaxID=3457416 RepID=UPI003FD468DF
MERPDEREIQLAAEADARERRLASESPAARPLGARADGTAADDTGLVGPPPGAGTADGRAGPGPREQRASRASGQYGDRFAAGPDGRGAGGAGLDGSRPGSLSGSADGGRAGGSAGGGRVGGGGVGSDDLGTGADAAPQKPILGADDANRVGAQPSGTDTGATTGPRGAGAGSAGVRPVMPRAQSDKLALRLQHAVTGFVDGPRRSVEEVDALFEETTARLTESLAERRRLLRTEWDGLATADDSGTEELRTALRDYRDLVQRLLKV